MQTTNKRTGVMTLRTLGRGFWLGILASLALHATLLSNGGLHIPKWNDSPTLEARLEPVEFKAVSLPEPDIAAETITVPAQPSQAAAERPTPIPADSPSAPPTPAQPAVPPAPENGAPPSSHPATPQPQTLPAPASSQTASTDAVRNLNKLPERLEIQFELDGMVSGQQTHRWQRNGERYTLETEGEVTGLASLFVRGKLTQISQGRIGANGLMPERYETRHINGKVETLRFDYDNNQIESARTDEKRGKRTLELPLLSGIQDPLSAIYQLAMLAQSRDDGLIVAASAKRVKGYAYRILGNEKLDAAIGEITALHIARAGDSSGREVHLWLSATHHYLPVKISYVDDDGNAWILQATRIHTEHAAQSAKGFWPPKREAGVLPASATPAKPDDGTTSPGNAGAGGSSRDAE